MRGTVAKKLRQAAREHSLPTEQKIKWFKRWTGKFNDKGEKEFVRLGTVYNTGYRAVYQKLKQAYRINWQLARAK